jgi:hypothetical protein
MANLKTPLRSPIPWRKPLQVLAEYRSSMDNLDEEHCEMPNFFSAFTSEVFRPLVTLLIPGAIAISTWFVGLLWQFHDLRTLVHNNHTEGNLVLVLAMTFAGLVLEDMGARVESLMDSLRDKKVGSNSITGMPTFVLLSRLIRLVGGTSAPLCCG